MRVYASLLLIISCLFFALYAVLMDYKQNTAYALELYNTQTYGKYFSPEQLSCLYENIYFEARNQPKAGQLAVMYVTLNRVDDPRFPNSICEVVRQGNHRPSWRDKDRLVPIKHQCHFSWYCDGKSDTPRDQDRWFEAQMIAWSMMEYEKYRGISEGATHYHATYVNPRWAKDLQLVGRIGAHIFYRWE